MRIACTNCKYRKTDIGPLSAAVFGNSHSLRLGHSVTIYDEKGDIAETFIHIPSAGPVLDDPPF